MHTHSASLSFGTHAKNYGIIVGLLFGSWLLSLILQTFMHDGTFSLFGEQGKMFLVFFEIILIFSFGFLAYETAKPTIIPSFVLAIFIGIIQKDSLSVIVQHGEILSILTTIGAIFILFGGGLDTPFTRFKELLGPILSIAVFGTIITAFLFSASLSFVSEALGTLLPLGAIILLGATLSSTDPAAIIPVFKTLTFKHPRVKYLAVSESAINDVIGTVLTSVFLFIVLQNTPDTSFIEIYKHLLSLHVLAEIFSELGIGVIVGLGGFFILRLWSKWKEKVQAESEADASLFLIVPLLCYVTSASLGGSGFLAVFISSLLFHLQSHVQHVEHYFNHTIEGFMKPLIFILLGAIVDISSLLEVTTIGLIMGALFILIIRPIAVFLTLSPFIRGKHSLNWRELLFLSFVRETGVIPAVLLIGLRVSGLPGADTAIAIGLWVILLTLIIQPPLTPLLAKKLGIVIDQPAFPLSTRKGPIAVLCSRGNSFMQRMSTVVEWCQRHGVKSILLLHCPELKFTDTYIAEIEKKASNLFTSINQSMEASGQKHLHFEFIGRHGLLQNNIEQLLRENTEVSIVFVGNKMLDYRIHEIKRLQVPFVFIH